MNQTVIEHRNIQVEETDLLQIPSKCVDEDKINSTASSKTVDNATPDVLQQNQSYQLIYAVTDVQQATNVLEINKPCEVQIKKRTNKAERKLEQALMKVTSQPSLQIEAKPPQNSEQDPSHPVSDQKIMGQKQLNAIKSKVSDDEINQSREAEEEMTDSLMQQLNSSIGNGTTDLSSKKLQYLEQDILDKRGIFKYTDDPNNYKKARKRLQNRESAVRSRSRKANELEDLRKEVKVLKKEREAHLARITQLEQSNKQWKDLFSQTQMFNQMNNQQLQQNMINQMLLSQVRKFNQ